MVERVTTGVGGARAGFTVIEVLIALTVLVICVTGTVGLLRWVVRGTDFSTRMSGATIAAEAKLERLTRQGATASGSEVTNGFNLSWTIAATGGVRYLSVRAQFTGMEGAEHGVTLRQIASN